MLAFEINSIQSFLISFLQIKIYFCTEMKKLKLTYLLIAGLISVGTFAYGQETDKNENAKRDYSLAAIQYYFKKSENSHLSSKAQSWNFSYLSADKKKLQKFADDLNKGVTKPKPLESRNGSYVFTLKERAKYNAEGLYNRIQELNKKALGYGLDSIASFYVDVQ